MKTVRINSPHPSHRPMRKQIQTTKSVVLNFGRPHKRHADVVINTPKAIARCKNKIKMKQCFDEAQVRSPKWCLVDGRCFTDYTGRVIYKPKYHSRGRGLVIFDSPQDCVNAKRGCGGTMEVMHRFTKEYRVHIFNGYPINIDRKYLREGCEEQEIRHKTHYIYSRVVKYPEDLIDVSIRAVKALGLHFGAVDVGFDGDENKCYALEVNSAPAMRESLVDRYKAVIYDFVENEGQSIPQIIEEFERNRPKKKLNGN